MKVERTGEGDRAFVGVHGWAGNIRTFKRLYPCMPPDAAFYATNLPGYGGTAPPQEWRVDPVLEHIAQTVRSISSKDVTLVCNCGGAQFGLETLRVHGPIADRVVLIDPFAFCPWYFSIFTRGRFGRNAYYTTFANPLGRFITNGVLRRRRRADTSLTAAFEKVDHEVALQYMRLMRSLEDAARFEGLTADIDIAYGERTFPAVRRSLPIWRAVFPNARFHELAGAGHEPIREATEQVANVVFQTGAPVQTSGGAAL